MLTVKRIPNDHLSSIIPLLELLNPDLSRDVIASRLTEIQPSNYQCIGVYDNTELIAISGVWILHKIYAGKHIEPDNVIVHPDFRSKGIGELLLNWIHQYAIEQGCITSELNSRVGNEDGNNFWKRMGYQIVGYHFIKPLTPATDAAANSCLLPS